MRARQPHPSALVSHVRQSRPDYGLGLQVEVLKTFSVVPFSAHMEPPTIPASALH